MEWADVACDILKGWKCPHIKDPRGMTFRDQHPLECSYGTVYRKMREAGILPKILPREEKSNSQSEELRNDGNKAYGKYDYSAAIQLYTKAVCAALPNSKEMALAYANRSAVTFRLGSITEGIVAYNSYLDPIADVDHALSTGSYPDNLKYKLYERKAMSLMNQGQYAKALADCEQTKTHLQNSGLSPGKIKWTSSLIDQLIRACQKENRNIQLDVFPKPITLTHEPSPYIESASSAVDITYYPSGMGRGVVATRKIDPGDVLAIEKYYASALLPTGFLDHCDNCMKECLSPVPCISCNTVVYCSNSCFQSSWTSYHSIECSILPSLVAYFKASSTSSSPYDVEVQVHLGLRLFLIASRCGTDIGTLIEFGLNCKKPSDPSKLGFVGGKYLSNNYSSIHHLVTNEKSCDGAMATLFAVQAMALMLMLKEGTLFFDNLNITVANDKQLNQCYASDLTYNHFAVTNLLMMFLMIVVMNGKDVEESGTGFGRIGFAVYPFFSLFNHSCDPNVSNFPYEGDHVYVVATQPVRKGQQLFTSYRWQYEYKCMPLPLRQFNLNTFCFTCQCPACVENWPVRMLWPKTPVFKRLHDKDWILENAKKVEDVFKAVKRQHDDGKMLAFIVQFMNRVFDSVKLPWEPYTRCQEALKLSKLYAAYADPPMAESSDQSKSDS